MKAQGLLKIRPGDAAGIVFLIIACAKQDLVFEMTLKIQALL